MPVKLNNVLTSNVAGVSNFYFDGVFAVCFESGSAEPFNVPVKSRIGKPVAERILNYALVTCSVIVVNRAEITFCIGGFVPLITEVNTFLIG